MKKLTLLIIFIVVLVSFLYGDFKNIKEKRYNIYYEHSLNLFSLDYVVKLLSIMDDEFSKKFVFTNRELINVYLYCDTVKFMNEQKAMWWQNYEIKSNKVCINNIDLLLEKNSLHILLKYIFFKLNLKTLYNDKLPVWFINGLAIFYSDKQLFKQQSLRFTVFKEFINKLSNYTTKEQWEAANYCCYKGIKYLVDQYGEDKIREYIGSIKDEKEFRNKFFNFFGITYKEFIRFELNLQ